MQGCQDHYAKIDLGCPECARFLEPPLTVAALRSHIAKLEARLAQYRALNRCLGMTDGGFVAEFERIYWADTGKA